MSSKGTGKMENLEANIVIIGGGASGLSAALSAADAGAENIIVLEKAKITGGNGRLAVAPFMEGAPERKQIGIDVSKDEMFKRCMDYAHWKNDPRLVRTWINISGEVAAWLEGKGLKDILYHGLGKTPGLVGRTVVETLTRECQRLGVKVLLGTSASRILTDKKQMVTGVLATTKDKEFKITTRSVIIGTGGFARNKKMMKKYFPAYNENMLTHSLPQMTGDGLLMAEEAGAFIDKDSIIIFFFGPHHYAWNRHLTYLHRIPEMTKVNKRGERYVAESHDFNSRTNALNRQPGCISYTLFDTKLKQEIIEKEKPMGPGTEVLADRKDWLDVIENAIKKEVDNGRIKISDSWDEIAKFIGAKPEVLKATIEQYNAFCDAGYDADFLKDKECLWPLRTPPYYAIISAQGYDVTNGGIKVNHCMEVLNKQDDPILGLYAAGSDAGGLHSCSSIVGSGAAPGGDFHFAICSGYLAGENAAKYVQASRK